MVAAITQKALNIAERERQQIARASAFLRKRLVPGDKCFIPGYCPCGLQKSELLNDDYESGQYDEK